MWLIINGRGELCHQEAVDRLTAFVAAQKANGFNVTPHPIEADRYTLTHPTKPGFEVYVGDEEPPLLE